MKLSNTKTNFITLAALLFAVLGFTTMANASTSPFAQNDVDNTSVVTKGGDKKCGEGKCGDKKAKKCGEGKCGDKKAKKDGKAKKEGKCGEGKCGDKK